MVAIRIFLGFASLSFALTLECMQKGSSRVWHKLGVSNKQVTQTQVPLERDRLQVEFILLRNKCSLGILIFGWTKLDKKRFVSCGELYICRVSFLWASSKRVFVSRESNGQSQRTCMTLFNNHHHTAAWVANTSRGKGKGNSIYHGKLVRSFSYLRWAIDDSSHRSYGHWYWGWQRWWIH